MFECKRTPDGFCIIFSASHKNADIVCLMMKDFLTNNVIPCDAFTIEVGLREILNNAVRHGSENDSTKTISFNLAWRDNVLSFHVRDEGQGFDWRKAIRHSAEVNETHGRGIGIIQVFFDTVIFNLQGNEITCLKKVSRETTLNWG